ncbi:MAG TPA: hypothetical protein VE863_20295 [Pyrinomonadaceae bacterium]|jgi:hypothetical protein|nr:hypothetical protein [Pyrinomonadaceae bacterium]
MNTKTILLAAAIILSLLLGLTIYAQKQNEGRVNWEYHVWNFSTWQEATARLTADGGEGWELVTVTETPTTSFQGNLRSGTVTLYLKRAK